MVPTAFIDTIFNLGMDDGGMDDVGMELRWEFGARHDLVIDLSVFKLHSGGKRSPHCSSFVNNMLASSQ